MNPRSAFSPLSLLIALTLLAALAACGAEPATHKPEAPPAGQTVDVQVAPPSATVGATGTVAFAATVTGTQNTNVTWSLQPAGCGSLTGTGVFTAPGAAATCTVRATSDSDPTRSAAAVVTVTAPPPPPPPPTVAVTVSPASAALNGCGTQTFTATVTGTTNTAVTWAVQEGAAGGTITPQGVYTAPSGAGTYHAVATSVADGTKVATAQIVVTERVLSVTISPPNVTVTAGGTAQFTATVTTTCGAFQATKTITAPRTAAAN
jgi:hypothetical protein